MARKAWLLLTRPALEKYSFPDPTTLISKGV